jgi:CheY-like chemotaxis protein
VEASRLGGFFHYLYRLSGEKLAMAKDIIFLLVDDDTDDSFLFGEALRETEPGIQFKVASSGHEALLMLREHRPLPDVIFLDLNMPIMSGKELLGSLKYDSQFQQIPVIIYTTSSHSKDIEETLQMGALCFITKPSNLADIRAIITTVAGSLPHNLDKGIKLLSRNTSTYIIS